MKNKIFIALCVLGLVTVRFVSNQFFYDPLTAFFHDADYKMHALPAIQIPVFTFFLLLRFALNTGIGALLVYFSFKKIELVRLTLLISAVVGVVLIPQVVWLSIGASPDEYAWLFYARRMLIHPLLILILLPAYMYYVYDLKKATHD